MRWGYRIKRKIVNAILVCIIVIVIFCGIPILAFAGVLSLLNQFSDFGFGEAMWLGITGSDRVFDSIPYPILIFLVFYSILMSKVDIWLILMVFSIALWIVLKKKRI